MRMVRTLHLKSSGKWGQATDHAAIMQNQHLAVLAGVLGMEHFGHIL
jgi:hypothetical protein